MGDRPHWVLTQKTFTKWANVPLNGAHIINDVEKGLDDGLVLIALLEALRKQRSTSSATRTRRCGGAAGNKADASKTALLERVNSKAVEHKVKNLNPCLNDGNTLWS